MAAGLEKEGGKRRRRQAAAASFHHQRAARLREEERSSFSHHPSSQLKATWDRGEGGRQTRSKRVTGGEVNRRRMGVITATKEERDSSDLGLCDLSPPRSSQDRRRSGGSNRRGGKLWSDPFSKWGFPSKLIAFELKWSSNGCREVSEFITYSRVFCSGFIPVCLMYCS